MTYPTDYDLGGGYGFHLGGHDPTPVPIRHYLCIDSEVIPSWDTVELVSIVEERFPEARQVPARGQHDMLPWDMVSIFTVDDATKTDGVHTVAYMWRERM